MLSMVLPLKRQGEQAPHFWNEVLDARASCYAGCACLFAALPDASVPSPLVL